ncbi:MAG: Hsp33 family molecular chaperone HslO [Candidatus Riflebacteria bacterium]|nr:Hsp33 family molecular chaperone HslO [Candidatus Riflebacteria bacterium]
MDYFLTGYSQEKNLELTYVNVTDAAKKLEKQHRAGPLAALFMGQGMAAAALLSDRLTEPDGRISLQVAVDGPVKGCFADAGKNGNIRAYTNIKTLTELDQNVSENFDKILGAYGQVAIIASTSTQVLSASQLASSPFNFSQVVARYYNNLGFPTAVEITAVSHAGSLCNVVALKVTKQESCMTETFVEVLERFNDKTIKKALEQNLELPKILKILKIEDLKPTENRTLTAECQCTRDKILRSVAYLPISDLEDILQKNGTVEAICHFCSKVYLVNETEIASILREKKNKSEESE